MPKTFKRGYDNDNDNDADGSSEDNEIDDADGFDANFKKLAHRKRVENGLSSSSDDSSSESEEVSSRGGIMVVKDYHTIKEERTGKALFTVAERVFDENEVDAPLPEAPKKTILGIFRPTVALSDDSVSTTASTHMLETIKIKAQEEWTAFQTFRTRNAKVREYPTLQWFEERIKEQEKEKIRTAKRFEKTQRANMLATLKLTKRLEEASQRRDERQQQIEEFQATSLAEVKEAARSSDLILQLAEDWHASAVVNAKNAVATAAAARRESMQAATDNMIEARRRRYADRQTQVHDEGQRITQDILAIARRAGIVGGVNPPLPREEEPPRETDTRLEIFVRTAPLPPKVLPVLTSPRALPAGKKQTTAAAARIAARKAKEKTSGCFNVDLLAFSDVTELAVKRPIGAPGGCGLGHDIKAGALPNLVSLYLQHARIRDKGLAAILDSFLAGFARQVRVLDLTYNELTSAGATALGAVLEAGVPPLLRDVDLSWNSLGDGGGRSIAHQLLRRAGKYRDNTKKDSNDVPSAGLIREGAGWAQLSCLRLRGCGMHDGGVRALCSALKAEGARQGPGGLEIVCIRDNYASPVTRAMNEPVPLFLQM